VERKEPSPVCAPPPTKLNTLPGYHLQYSLRHRPPNDFIANLRRTAAQTIFITDATCHHLQLFPDSLSLSPCHLQLTHQSHFTSFYVISSRPSPRHTIPNHSTPFHVNVIVTRHRHTSSSHVIPSNLLYFPLTRLVLVVWALPPDPPALEELVGGRFGL